MTYQNKKSNQIPIAQGLYDPSFEHDACGIGIVVNIKGNKENRVIKQGLTILKNLTHRGARGAEPNTGDGAGILIQLPHKFLKRKAERHGFTLPEPGNYAVGMVFLPKDVNHRRAIELHFEKVITAEGCNVLGWRTIKVDNSQIGATALRSEPKMRMIFIEKSPEMTDIAQFERKLFLIRKRAENEIRYGDSLEGGEFFYVASLSPKTMIYKGMFVSDQVEQYFQDLLEEDIESAIALVHSRFSTNTFPSWERAHPYRYVIHNGEINTLRGNVNWFRAAEKLLESEAFGDDLQRALPIIRQDGSDTAMFDNCLEFLTLNGRSLPHCMMMMIPEPWSQDEQMDPEKRAFYEFHANIMEPWDGPAAMGFTDGVQVGAMLDRNGLRPSRYVVTNDDQLILASEVGVLNIPTEKIVYKGRLSPGKMLLVDTEQQRIISDEEIKKQLSTENPYQDWLNKYQVQLQYVADPKEELIPDNDPRLTIKRQKAFGYTQEEIQKILLPMAIDHIEPIGAMGNDTPPAILSDKPSLLFNYFRQLFAQVTNPPIDSIRENMVIATEVMVGAESNLLKPNAQSCHQIRLDHPFLTNKSLAKIRHSRIPGFITITLPTLFKRNSGGEGLEKAMNDLLVEADSAIARGFNLFILSDRDMDDENVPMPSLLALSGLHQHLVKNGTRGQVGLIVESAEPREVHHFAALLGYGAAAINPYLVYDTIESLVKDGFITKLESKDAVKNYSLAATKGVVKTISKMGISSIQSYCGAQIFEALGIHQTVIDKYFAGTPSRIGGVDIDIIAEEAQMRHDQAYKQPYSHSDDLADGGVYQWRKNGEYHQFNPETIRLLQRACREENFALFKEYSSQINEQEEHSGTLRSLLRIKTFGDPIPLEEVESVDSICRRFKTGAMSYGSISKEAHEALAIAMNRLHGKSNTGEGGEDPARFKTMKNGDSKRSAIKQVASARFGVTSEYLVNADEIQIKMAQGAKPGEGGQLPGKKVYPWIAEVRHSTPGVGLISPPPHHDIYSIEDLAELIHDLKNANPNARINVKLVSEVGVGTIAAGVAKAHADVILISGHDGGTGASPLSSIQYAGLPWELGLAETNQTLILNNLRGRVVLETDGQLKTGRDVVIAALLGAEEFGFATAPLVTLGCVMMRVCHQDTCPVGVATQNPELRKNFTGKPEYVETFMRYIAEETREWMARLGFRTIDEMVGQVNRLRPRNGKKPWKARSIDLSNILYQPEIEEEETVKGEPIHYHDLENSLDKRILLDICRPALENKQRVTTELPIHNTNRVVGTYLGSQITKLYGAKGLPDDTIHLRFVGSAGQSFGAFIPNGITLELEGDANDYIGKGLSGGKIVCYPPKGSPFRPESSIIIGNVAFYGATRGKAFISGFAGERFCVRNSGITAVVEGMGNHGCEYMTGGIVVNLASVGRNFAAGMSGGIAFNYDPENEFKQNVNLEMVTVEKLTDVDDKQLIFDLITEHHKLTHSPLAAEILEDWKHTSRSFKKVVPMDYARMMRAFEISAEKGLTGDELALDAFEISKKMSV